eukprot:scaffold676_cov115-Isochrysis_galbana.AAC.13
MSGAPSIVDGSASCSSMRCLPLRGRAYTGVCEDRSHSLAALRAPCSLPVLYPRCRKEYRAPKRVPGKRRAEPVRCARIGRWRNQRARRGKWRWDFVPSPTTVTLRRNVFPPGILVFLHSYNRQYPFPVQYGI